MTIAYREMREWPGERTPTWRRSRAPFKAHATRLWDLLERELQKVNAKDVSIFGYWRPRDFKRDGGVYADARPTEPGIVVEFVKGKDRMRFSCDRYLVWLDNVDAIGRSLEALRMMERYGVMAGQQYEGFKALPPQSAPAFTGKADALAFISKHSPFPVSMIEHDADKLREAIRFAKNRCHPDRDTGSHELYVRVTEAERAVVA